MNSDSLPHLWPVSRRALVSDPSVLRKPSAAFVPLGFKLALGFGGAINAICWHLDASVLTLF